MTFPTSDARRRHELVLTVPIDKGYILPFEVDEPHVYEVRGHSAPTSRMPNRTGDRVQITPLANYRIMVELSEMAPGKRFPKSSATSFKELLLKTSTALGLTTTIEILGEEVQANGGKSTRNPNRIVSLPADHGFVVTVRDKNGAAEEILKLKKAIGADRTPPDSSLKPKSKAEAKKITQGLIRTGNSLKPHFGGRVFDEEKVITLGAAFEQISRRGFSAEELFDLTDSLEHRVHRRFNTDDIVTLSKSIRYFSDQGYGHDDVLRLARVAATIQGPVLCFRGNFENKKEMVKFSNTIIKHAIQTWNRARSDQNVLMNDPTFDGLPDIVSMCSFFSPSDVPHGAASLAEFGARLVKIPGVMSRRMGSNIPFGAVVKISFGASDALNGIARNLHNVADRFQR